MTLYNLLVAVARIYSVKKMFLGIFAKLNWKPWRKRRRNIWILFYIKFQAVTQVKHSLFTKLLQAIPSELENFLKETLRQLVISQLSLWKNLKIWF